MSYKLYLEQSGYAGAVALEKILSKKNASFLLTASIGLGGLFLFLAVAFVNETFLALAEIVLAIFFSSLLYYLFLDYAQADKLLTAEVIQAAWEKQEYGRSLTFSSARILERGSHGEALNLLAFFTFLLRQPRFLWVLRRLNISASDFSKKIKDRYAGSENLPLEQLFPAAWQKAIAGNHLHVRYSDLLMTVYDLDKIFQDILFEYEIEEAEMRQVAYWQRRIEERRSHAGKFWHRHNLLNIKGVGKGWEGGFTVNLDRVAEDLTERAKIHKSPVHLYGHRSILELVERMLLRSAGSANVALVGEPGVGRHTLLQAFAARVNAGAALGPLRYMRLLQIDSGAIIAGTASPSEVLDKIQILFGEAALASNVILVINNIDAFLDPHPESPGRINATEALLPFFQSSLRIIGITTYGGYQSTIGKNPQLERLISKLEVSEPSPAQTLLILADEVLHIERQSGLFFTHRALKEIVNLATKLIQNLPNPEKSLEILQETAVYVATKTGERAVTLEHVQKVVTLRTKVPVEKVEGAEKETLLNLESILHQRIVGQEEAVQEVASALRRARTGIRSEKKPIGSFLFLGPTGVGKTETTKALAAVYFGSESRIIRFDMSEFQEVHGINRLIGDADTKTGGLLTESVIGSPFSLILLDEIEKAHPKILDLFLQMLDEGRLTDALGRTVNFTNTMIIATSNAGAEFIRQMVREGRNPAAARDELLNHLQSQGLFRPEFLNRFDAVIIFRPLTPEEQAKVATLLLQELNKRLAEKDIQINVTPELAASVVRGGYNPEFGARPLRRFIQEHIENYVARGLLEGSIQRGQVVEIDLTVMQK